jgi:DNA-3-methyladenine glycosylase
MPDDDAPLPRSFFARDVRVVARDLLGRTLRTVTAEGVAAGRIIETEAYRRDESCCHTFRGRTPRNGSMFGPPGTVYVYFIYGMHHCVNLVGEAEGSGCAVLLRALAPLEGLALMRQRRGPKAPDARLTHGPGSLCRALGIDRGWDGLDATASDRIALLAGEAIGDHEVVTSPRVGVVGRPEHVALPWRWAWRGVARSLSQ